MKKYKLFYAFILSLPLSIFAQKNAQGCDGKRYLKDVFTETTITAAVQYGASKPSLGPIKPLFMDIFEPKSDTLSKRPVIILAFGGGFVNGTRAIMNLFCQYYAQKGYVCATIDYRLWEFQSFPDSVGIANIGTQAMHDMKAAIRFFRKDAATTNTYRIDPDNVVAGGISSGGITAMLVGHLDSTDVIADFYRAKVTEQGGFEGNSGNPGYSSAVKAVINMSGGIYRKEIIDKNDPPFVSYHGTADNIVPYGFGKNVYSFFNDGSATCFDQAKAVGVPSVLYSVKGGGHTDIYGNAYLADVTNFQTAALLFLKQVVCGDPITTATLSPTSDIEASSIALYPNPSNDVISIDFTKNTEGPLFDISVVDVAGRVVFQQRNASNIVQLSKNSIGSGLFFVKIGTKNAANTVVKKVVFN